jgi:acyl-CoA thioesterase FadM
MVISSEVRRGGELLVSGYVVLVSVNFERKVIRMPKEFIDTCKQFSYEEESNSYE